MDNKGLSSDNYVVIQGWMCNELKLKGNDLLVFALIYGFCQDGKGKFCGGRNYIADTFNISLPTVDKALQHLIELGYITKQQAKDYVHTDTYQIMGGSKETLLGVVKKLYQGSKETLPNKISNNINNNIDSNSTKVELEQPTVTQSNTPKRLITVVPATLPIKEKKKNLYDKCQDVINEFTSDIEMQERLTEYLNVRLERKDIQFSSRTFKGMLSKLTRLSGDKTEQLDIIQQSIDRVYPTFYPLNKFSRKDDTDKFGEYGQVKSVRSKESDRTGVHF